MNKRTNTELLSVCSLKPDQSIPTARLFKKNKLSPSDKDIKGEGRKEEDKVCQGFSLMSRAASQCGER